MDNPFRFTRRQFVKRLALLIGGIAMPGLHELALPSIIKATSEYPFEILSVNFAPTVVRIGDLLTVTVVVRNNSNEVLPTQAPDPGFVYEEGESFKSFHFNEAPGTVRFCVNYQDWDGVAYPYRWGLGKPLNPGETRTLIGRIHLRGPQKWEYWVGAVREWTQWYQSDLGRTLIEATPTGIGSPTNTPSAPPTNTPAPSGTLKILSVNFAPTALQIGQVLTVQFTLRNDSPQTIVTQEPAPGFIYDEGTSFVANYPAIAGMYRVGVDFDGRSGMDHPYRWGLGGPLAPGETRIINGGIRLKNARNIGYWGGLVQEYVSWMQDRVGVQPIVVTNPNPSPQPVNGSRVVHIHSEAATSWNGQWNYQDYVAQNVVNDMVDRGMRTLTGAASLAEAWRTLLPNYQPGQSIAIKVNCNNEDDSRLNTTSQTINAILRGLIQMGVRPNDIVMFDAIRRMPDRFANRNQYPGVGILDNGTGRFANAGFDAGEPSATLTFAPPPGIPMPPKIKITDVLVRATYVINVPILKAHLGSAGVTLAFKNHFGSINHPEYLHDYMFPGAQYFRVDYNPLVDLYRNANVGKKTIITIAEGLFTGNRYDSLPMKMRSFENQPPNSLFFATDPVALDSVLYDFLAAEFQLPDGADNYLRLASAAGLGTFERGNPWGAGYRTIDYRRIET